MQMLLNEQSASESGVVRKGLREAEGHAVRCVSVSGVCER